jgi:activator of HSP90 ATPase
MTTIENYLDKTDLILYNKIIQLIYKKWDEMDSSTLSDLLDKLRELHQNLDSVILQKKQHDLFNKEYYKSNFDRGNVKESVDLKSISLSKMIPHSHRFRKQIDKRD